MKNILFRPLCAVVFAFAISHQVLRGDVVNMMVKHGLDGEIVYNDVGIASTNVLADMDMPMFEDGPYFNNWLHSDIQDVAYFYTYNLFNKFVTGGGLAQ